jgi:hypothetical protein
LAIAHNPALASDRAKRDVIQSAAIKQVWSENYQAYGARKIWHRLQRESHSIVRCRVERLMKVIDSQRVTRGKHPKTTSPDPALSRLMGCLAQFSVPLIFVFSIIVLGTGGRIFSP